MTSKTDVNIQRAQKLKHVQGEGSNWVLIAGGALLSTLTIKLGWKLKQVFEAKRSNNGNNAMREKGKAVPRRKLRACKSHSNLYCFCHDEDGCYHGSIGSGGAVDTKHLPISPMSKSASEISLQLVNIPTVDSNKENGGVMWISSPDRLELPAKRFHRSNCSDSISESGSDIYSKREVIQKLRQQLKRRDEMIMEMQIQITDLQNSASAQMAHIGHLQSQLDSTNRDLFDSEREIQRLRKAIADHCMGGSGSSEKPMITRNWHSESTNGHTNGHADSLNDMELHCISPGKSRGERIDMLKREAGELKEVIEGKEMLLQSY